MIAQCVPTMSRLTENLPDPTNSHPYNHTSTYYRDTRTIDLLCVDVILPFMKIEKKDYQISLSEHLYGPSPLL